VRSVASIPIRDLELRLRRADSVAQRIHPRRVECYSITHEVLPEAENLLRRQTVAEVRTYTKQEQAPKCQIGKMKYNSITGPANTGFKQDTTQSTLPDAPKTSMKIYGVRNERKNEIQLHNWSWD